MCGILPFSFLFFPSNFQLNILYLFSFMESRALLSGESKKDLSTCPTNGPFYLSEHDHILFIPIFCKISISIIFLIFCFEKNVHLFVMFQWLFSSLNLFQACKRALRFTVIHLSNKYLLTTYHTSVIWNASVNRSDSNCCPMTLYFSDAFDIYNKHNK